MSPSVKPDRAFPCLNAVRAVAALGVVATHSAFDTGQVTRGWTGAVLSRLDFGVTLFFVLSGFLLSRPFFLARARRLAHPSYEHFVWKRALRILPLYWLVVVLALFFVPENDGASAAVWLRELTLTQIYVPEPLSYGLTQMWSLCTEVAFYAILPALCLLLFRVSAGGEWRPRRLLGWLGVIGVLGLVWQGWAAPHSVDGAHYGQWLPGFLPWFGIGMAFAVISADSRLRPRARLAVLADRLGTDLLGCWLVAGAVFAIACTPVAGPRLLTSPTAGEAVVKSILYGATAAFLILPLVFGPERAGTARRVAASPSFTWLGDVSYGIFCWHLLALETTLSVLDVTIFTGHFVDVFLVTCAATIAVSAISYYALERPFLRLKNVGRFATTSTAPIASDASIRT